jgi:hypothetical protein
MRLARLRRRAAKRDQFSNRANRSAVGPWWPNGASAVGPNQVSNPLAAGGSWARRGPSCSAARGGAWAIAVLALAADDERASRWGSGRRLLGSESDTLRDQPLPMGLSVIEEGAQLAIGFAQASAPREKEERARGRVRHPGRPKQPVRSPLGSRGSVPSDRDARLLGGQQPKQSSGEFPAIALWVTVSGSLWM